MSNLAEENLKDRMRRIRKKIKEEKKAKLAEASIPTFPKEYADQRDTDEPKETAAPPPQTSYLSKMLWWWK
jgi:hypothetical protein